MYIKWPVTNYKKEIYQMTKGAASSTLAAHHKRISQMNVLLEYLDLYAQCHT